MPAVLRTAGLLLLLLTAVLALAVALFYGRWSHPDLTLLYTSAEALRLTSTAYAAQGTGLEVNANAPLVMWLLQVITWWTDQEAYVGLIVASLAALAGTAAFITRGLGLSGLVPLVALLLVLQSTAVTLEIGQLSLLMLPVMTAVWWADRSGRRTTAAACLGLLIYWKPFLGLFALDLVWRREWQAVAGLAATFLAAATAGLWAAGVDVSIAWLEDMGRMHLVRHNPVNASWAGFPARLFTDTAVSAGLWMAGAAAIGLVSARRYLRPLSVDQRWSLLGITSLLVSPIGWLYYLPLFYGPLVATLRGGMTPLVIAAIVALSVPPRLLFSALPRTTAFALMTSMYLWGLLALWAAVLRAPGAAAAGRGATGWRR